MSGPRVSFVVDSDGWGGAEIWLGHHLQRSTAHGVVASLVSTEGAAERLAPLTPGPVTTVPLVRHTPADSPEAQRLRDALAEQRPDLVVVNLVDPGSNHAALRAGLATAPTVGILHLSGDTGAGAEHAALAATYAELALVIGTATAAADQVRTELALPRGGVAVVRNGVEVPVDPHGPAGGRPLRVGVHARLTAQKGLDLLVEATRRLVADGLDLEVRIGGSGRDEAALRAAADGLPVGFTGWVEDHRAFLLQLDVFCHPSRHDALPLSLLEAMAEGLPCITTDVGDVRQRVGDAVELLPVGDLDALTAALRRVLIDDDHRARLAAAARHCAVERLDVAGTVAATYGLLGEVLRVG